MKRLIILLIPIILICSLMGCAIEEYVKTTSGDSSLKNSERISAQNEKGLNLLAGGKNREAVDHFYALVIKEPHNKEAYYNLALSYDKSLRKREAIRTYKEFLDMHSQDSVLVTKSNNRVRELKEDVAGKLVGEARELAEGHKYEDCLEKLESAYDLDPTTETANNIIEKYFTYTIRSIAWNMSSYSNSLKERTVSVIPFTSLSKEESKQGSAVATELVDEFINMKKLSVYSRDDESIKYLLKEIELAETGLIDETTKKELGNLVNTEAVVVGRVGYVDNTFEINVRMILVETGRVIVSKNVNMLGWNVDDTDKNADFNISVSMDSKLYRVGDSVTIYLESDRDCYVTLLNVRSNGEIWELFPNKYNRNNFLPADTMYTVPSVNDNFKLSIVEPPGREYLKVIATSVPLSMDQIRRVLSNDSSVLVASAKEITRGEDPVFRSVSSTEMRGLHKILTRGMAVVPTSNSNPVNEQNSYHEPTSHFEHAVSTWPFETKR